ncbi:MAG: hypothetical protein QG668_322, partial [Patescibacteria group bacterium]|nr:hypothetical protein [Patescibacteria group bacterium]
LCRQERRRAEQALAEADLPEETRVLLQAVLHKAVPLERLA